MTELPDLTVRWLLPVPTYVALAQTTNYDKDQLHWTYNTRWNNRALPKVQQSRKIIQTADSTIGTIQYRYLSKEHL
jgi:hypothetical protein